MMEEVTNFRNEDFDLNPYIFSVSDGKTYLLKDRKEADRLVADERTHKFRLPRSWYPVFKGSRYIGYMGNNGFYPKED